MRHSAGLGSAPRARAACLKMRSALCCGLRSTRKLRLLKRTDYFIAKLGISQSATSAGVQLVPYLGTGCPYVATRDKLPRRKASFNHKTSRKQLETMQACRGRGIVFISGRLRLNGNC